MALSDDLRAAVGEIFGGKWTERNGQVVPEPAHVGLGNDAVKLEGAVLYADLAESTNLVNTQPPRFAAEIYKSYLYCAARLIRNNRGVVTAYDGDRVMGVFIGDTPRTNAARCALQINWARVLINEEMRKVYNTTFEVKQAVGVDFSTLFVARTGVRGDNDLVWVGRAANYAAKLSALRTDPYSSYITAAVFDGMAKKAKFGGDPKRAMWQKATWNATGETVYRSSWRSRP